MKKYIEIFLHVVIITLIALLLTFDTSIFFSMRLV